MLCSRISAGALSACSAEGSGAAGSELCIHWWLTMSSKEGRSAGRWDRHHLMSCWHSGEGRRARRGEVSPGVKNHTDGKAAAPPGWPECKLTCRDPPAEQHLAPGDLLVVLEGDVAAHHVVQQDPQRPHGGRAAVVAVVLDPLWRAVNSCACWVQKEIKKLDKNFYLYFT